MKNQILFSLCAIFSSTLAISKRDEFDPSNYASEDVITRDVAVIGGGATGVYSAINLRAKNKSVVVVEKEAVLGGHVNSYTDPTTGISVDYGTQVFWNISAATDYFKLLNLPYQAFAPNPTTTVYADFQTGKQVTGVQQSNNYTAYAAQLAKFPYLEFGWNLPSPIPAELLQPWKTTIAQYGLEDVAYSIFSDGEGFANILDQLTIHVFKLVDESFLSAGGPGGAIVPKIDNGQIYVKAGAILGSDALLSSTVVSAQRPSKGASGGVSLVVKTPSGQKLIQASKLLVSIPPLIGNMAPFGLDSTESSLFSQWTYTNYFVMLVNNTGLPTGYHFSNANASSSTYNIPQLPAPYQITSTRDPNLFYVWYGSPYNLTQAAVEADTTAVIKRLRVLENSTTTTEPTFVRFNSHTPFKLIVGKKQIQNGFYGKLENLQGYRDTFYTGAAFLSHDASELWNFTQAVVLPKVLA